MIVARVLVHTAWRRRLTFAMSEPPLVDVIACSASTFFGAARRRPVGVELASALEATAPLYGASAAEDVQPPTVCVYVTSGVTVERGAVQP